MKTKIGIISTDRADVGILRPIITALNSEGSFDTSVIATGSHMENDSLSTEFDIFSKVVTIGASMGGLDTYLASSALGKISTDCAVAYREENFDVILFAGDRMDLIAAVMPALPLNIPLIHVHGGEVSIGAIDDRVRHALTKFSHLHCVSNKFAAARVSRMGEEAWRICICGAPSIDTLISEKTLDRDQFLSMLNLPTVFKSPMCLMTVHPSTNSTGEQGIIENAISAATKKNYKILLTGTFSDPGANALMRNINKRAANENIAFTPHLGSLLYKNALIHSDFVIGNSSSGIVEAGFFQRPSINVGIRQLGRDKGPGVIDCDIGTEDIINAISKAENIKIDKSYLYGDGHSSARIVNVIRKFLPHNDLLRKKFADEKQTFTDPW